MARSDLGWKAPLCLIATLALQRMSLWLLCISHVLHSASSPQKRCGPSSDKVGPEQTPPEAGSSLSVWGPDIPLPFQTPPPYLPQLLGEIKRSGECVARFPPAAHSLQGHLALRNVALERSSTLSKGPSCKSKAAQAKAM